MENLTYGGHTGELDFWGGALASSSHKFGNTIVYYTTLCPLGGPWPPGSASCDTVDCE